MNRRLTQLAALVAVATGLALSVPGTATAAASGSPVLSVDSVAVVPGGVRVKGWAWDPSTTAAVTVRVQTGSVTTSTSASLPSAQSALYPAAGTSRGFDLSVVVPAGSVKVCVTAVNVGAGSNTSAPCTTVTVAPHSPFGNLDGVGATTDGVRVRGWVADPDTTAAVQLAVTIDGVRTTIATGVTRLDVPKTYPLFGSTTGFDRTLLAPAGTHDVCVTALNVGEGTNRSFGCRSVTVEDRSPVGALASAVDSGDGLVVSGWAHDVDASVPTDVALTATASTTTFTIAATAPAASTVVPADQTLAGDPEPHGFSTDLVLAPGTYRVCATAINTGPGADAGLGCATATVVDHSPSGALDPAVDSTVGGVQVSGWATDVDAVAPLTVALTLDGAAAGTVPASTARTDRPSADGFSTRLAAAPGQHRVCATAVNVGSGRDVALGCSSVTVVDHAPLGRLESTSGVTSGVKVTGWAADRDTTAPLDVVITVDGVASTVTANLTRSDVAATYPELPSTTGFSATVPAAAGARQVCATAVNAGPGSNVSLGCTSVTVPAPAPVVPSASTTGVPAGTVLTVHQGDLVVTTPGAVISNLDVRGFIDVRAANVTIRNTIVRGYAITSSRALVTVGSSAYSVTIEDSELAPTTPTPWTDGLRGMNITARRVNIHHVIDSVHIYGSNVTIVDSWLHDNQHYDSDPNWNGGGSHDDNVQIQVGSNITIRNNVISGSHSAAIMLTQDRGAVSGLTIEQNRIDNGACSVNVKNMPTAPTNVSLRDNTFGRAQIYSGCALKMPNTSYVLDLQRNYFTDGKAITITR